MGITILLLDELVMIVSNLFFITLTLLCLFFVHI